MTSQVYSPLRRALHWITVLLILSQWWTSRAVLSTHEHHGMPGHVPDATDMLLHRFHVLGGLAVLVVVMLRLALRLSAGEATLPAAIPGWARTWSRPAHLALYAVLAGLVLTGLIASYLWFPMSRVHGALVKALYGLILLHVGAVILHDVVHRAGLLRRMTRG